MNAMPFAPTLDTVAALLRDSTEWRLLELLLERPQAGWHEQLEAVAASTPDPQIRAAVLEAHEQASEGLYHTIFGPGGPAPPREVTGTTSLQPGLLVAELAAFYDAFAYRPSVEEPPDHVAVEIGFVAYLRLKEAYARARGNEEQAAITAEAAGRFVEEHLSHLAARLARTLADSGVSYLARASAALLARTGEPRRSVALDDALPIVRDEDDEESGCGLL